MKYVKLVLGSLLIALAYNILMIPNGFISFGTDGIGMIFNNLFNYNIALTILVINVVIISISLFINSANAFKYLYASLLIPLFIFLLSFVNVSIELPEQVLVVIISGLFIGFGYDLIYHSGFKAGTIFLLEEDIGDCIKIYTKLYSMIVDIIIVLMILFRTSHILAIYSAFIIFIARYITNKARYNLNDSKMFYVITNKDKQIKEYILKELGYELTELDVKGGYTNKKKSILLSVIAAKDYYKLKTGIMEIDKHAFVAITDTYDVINRKEF